MNSIGFKNFRKYRELPEMEFGLISFLVGKNNSGKSTVVKALMLIYEYLKSADLTVFSFSNNALEHTNIGTYGRAKNKEAGGDDFIEFMHKYGRYKINIKISANDSDTIANVHYFSILDTEEGFEFIIKPQLKEVSLTIHKQEVESDDIIKQDLIKKYEAELENLKLKMNHDEFLSNSGMEGMMWFAEINQLQKKLDKLKPTKKKNRNNLNVTLTTSYV